MFATEVIKGDSGGGYGGGGYPNGQNQGKASSEVEGHPAPAVTPGGHSQQFSK